ncbi:hypothetical protein TNCV_586761 [Trichonephila clavipes]|nr:hypothetical protein TNCV_586761 [Trichonephila clavipes]
MANRFQDLFLVESRKIAYDEEDQISSSFTHIKNLTSVTSSKYNELNGQATLSEWTKSVKFSIPNQLAHGKRQAKSTMD